MDTVESKALQSNFDKAYEQCWQDIHNRQTESTIAEKTSLLEQLKDFKFGRSLIESKQLTRYWRHFLLTYPFQERRVIQPKLFDEFINHFPISLAFQERYALFLQKIQTKIKNGAKLLSIPSGLMEDLAYLDYKHIDNIHLIAWDNEQSTLDQAKGICQTRGLAQWLDCVCADPWSIDRVNEFDVITSHGLTIYEINNEWVSDFYRKIHQALKPGGEFISAYVTPPPSQDAECEWDFQHINPAYLRKQNVVLFDVLKLAEINYRKSVETRKMLAQVGFRDIEFCYDKAKMFPSFIARKDSE